MEGLLYHFMSLSDLLNQATVESGRILGPPFDNTGTSQWNPSHTPPFYRIPNHATLCPTLLQHLQSDYLDNIRCRTLADPTIAARVLEPPSNLLLYRYTLLQLSLQRPAEGAEENYSGVVEAAINFGAALAESVDSKLLADGQEPWQNRAEDWNGGTRIDHVLYRGLQMVCCLEKKTPAVGAVVLRKLTDELMASGNVGVEIMTTVDLSSDSKSLLIKLCHSMTYGQIPSRWGIITDTIHFVLVYLYSIDSPYLSPTRPIPRLLVSPLTPCTTKLPSILTILTYTLLKGVDPLDSLAPFLNTKDVEYTPRHPPPSIGGAGSGEGDDGNSGSKSNKRGEGGGEGRGSKFGKFISSIGSRGGRDMSKYQRTKALGDLEHVDIIIVQFALVDSGKSQPCPLVRLRPNISCLHANPSTASPTTPPPPSSLARSPSPPSPPLTTTTATPPLLHPSLSSYRNSINPRPSPSLPLTIILSTLPMIGGTATAYRGETPEGVSLVFKYGNAMNNGALEREAIIYSLLATSSCFSSLMVPRMVGLFRRELGLMGFGDPGQVLVLEDCGEPINVAFTAVPLHMREKVMETLQLLHKEINILHGDFRKENLVISASGEIRIIDFSHSSHHLCEGGKRCAELVEARKILRL